MKNLFIALMLSIPLTAFSQTTQIGNVDITQELNKQLLAYNPPPKPKSCSDCATTPLAPATLVARNVSLIIKNVDIMETKDNVIPTSITRTIYPNPNCTSDEQSYDDTLTITYIEGNKVTLHNKLSTDTKTNFSLPLKYINFGLNTDVSVTNDSTEENNHQIQKTETRVEHVKVPPYTNRAIVLEKTIKNGYLRFKGTVIADADVVWQFPNGRTTPAVGKVSQTVPEEKRTFYVNGDIWILQAETSSTRHLDKKLDPNNLTDCPTLESLENSSTPLPTLNNLNIKSNVNKISTINQNKVVKLNSISNVNDSITTTLTDGMTINTADVVANVKVRAQSQGPGACATEVSTFGGDVGILAPPYSWSDWYTLVSHAGKSSFTISTDVKCDTGALFEIQYYPDNEQ